MITFVPTVARYLPLQKIYDLCRKNSAWGSRYQILANLISEFTSLVSFRSCAWWPPRQAFVATRSRSQSWIAVKRPFVKYRKPSE